MQHLWTCNNGTEPHRTTAALDRLFDSSPFPNTPSLHKSQGQDWQCHGSTQKVAEMLLPTPWASHPCGRASHAAAHMRYLATAAFGARSITKIMFVYSMHDGRGGCYSFGWGGFPKRSWIALVTLVDPSLTDRIHNHLSQGLIESALLEWVHEVHQST